MNRDDDGFRLYQKAFRPKPEEATGPDRRFRDPDEQAEVESRIAVYAQQIQKRGRMKWLPGHGRGESA